MATKKKPAKKTETKKATVKKAAAKKTPAKAPAKVVKKVKEPTSIGQHAFNRLPA